MKRILLEEFLEVTTVKDNKQIWYRCTCGPNKRVITLKWSIAMHKNERYRIIRVYGWIRQ